VDIRKANRKMFSSGVALAVVLAAGLNGAPAQTSNPPKKSTTASPPKTIPPKPVSTSPKPPTKKPPGPGDPSSGSKGTEKESGGEKSAGNGGSGSGSTGQRGGTFIRSKQPGEVAKSLPGGLTELRSPDGRTVTTNERGEVRRIERPSDLFGNRMVINRGPSGGRIVENGRIGNRVVSYGPRRGFVERSLPERKGYISRTYFAGGRSYAHVYREYRYGNFRYYRYVPAYYYGPRFYAWAVTPWAPAPYYWGDGITAPWVGFYAGYFAPYPIYASPDLWLTDYLFTENLRLAFESQQAANGGQPPSPQAQMDDPAQQATMKALIADEVRQQLEAEKADAAQPTSSSPQPAAPATEPIPPALKQQFFVASSNLDLTVAGKTCSLTPGDIIQRTGKVVEQNGTIAVKVVSSKTGDCPKESDAAVQLADLQEMHNQFREQLDNGLKMLADNQAKGFAKPPPAGGGPVAEGTAEPVPDVGEQLVAQEKAAGTLEEQVRQ
jgi:hypothetical protein